MTPEGRRVRMTAAERREQLIGIGRDLFAERGLEGSSVEELADRAAVSKPVVYEHFGGKEGLYAVVVDREIRRLLEIITTALDEAPHPRLKIERAAEALLGYIEKERAGFTILVRNTPVGAATGSFSTVIVDVVSTAQSQLAAEFEARGYDPATAPIYAQALVGMVAHVGQWWLDSGEPGRREVAWHLVNLAWNGMKDLRAGPPFAAG